MQHILKARIVRATIRSLAKAFGVAITASALLLMGCTAFATSASATVPVIPLQFSAGPSGAGYSYDIQIVAPDEVTPEGMGTATDDVGGSCASDAWVDHGTDGSSGFVYTVQCAISTAEPAGTTVSVGYAGTDYTAVPNQTTISGGLTLTATTPAGSAGSYTSIVMATLLVANSDAAPVDQVDVELQDGAAQCLTPNLGTPLPDGLYTSYSAECVLTTGLPFQGAAIGFVTGSDYVSNVASFSRQVTLGGTFSPSLNQYEMNVLVPVGGAAPTGTATVTDTDGDTCNSSVWTDEGFDSFSSERYEATCSITGAETVGANVSATYVGNHSFGQSNVFDIMSLALTGSPVTSASGNTYLVTLDQIEPTPSHAAFVEDQNGNSCTPSVWTPTGSDGSGGNLFTAPCTITSPESGGTVVFATYGQVGSNQLTVAAAAATSLSLSGTPTASVSGNSFSITLDAPTDVMPLGFAHVVDTAPGSCTASSWTDDGADGHGGELFGTSCSISTAEVAGETVIATYVGNDYTGPTTNVLTVSAAPSGGGGGGSSGGGSSTGGTTSPSLQAPLVVTSTSGRIGSTIALTTSGGSGTGVTSFTVTNGTGKGCAVSGDTLRATSSGTCVVTATKSGDPVYSSVSSAATVVTLALPSRPPRVTVVFASTKNSLSSRARTSLLALSKELIPGASVTVTGYANGRAPLARARARVVARYLLKRVAIHVLIKVSTRSRTGRSTLETTSQ
ncbi:MAG TPA: hypothetical protein VG246_10905 [Acidimicrobiales bacterium]|nr:hypothetical protein [Acidimicrobiales bacterium]